MAVVISWVIFPNQFPFNVYALYFTIILKSGFLKVKLYNIDLDFLNFLLGPPVFGLFNLFPKTNKTALLVHPVNASPVFENVNKTYTDNVL